MLLVIDNYDSFTWNLVQLLGELGHDPRVIRNDARSVSEIMADRPDHVVLSPGPCSPTDAGVSIDLVRALEGRVPILGVCLGHQAIAEAYGGRTVRAHEVMHGKVSGIRHSGEGLFAGLPDPLPVARYHSLVTDPEALPSELEVVAWSGEWGTGKTTSGGGPAGEIQAIRHRTDPVWGVQFHPESLFSSEGRRILENFMSL